MDATFNATHVQDAGHLGRMMWGGGGEGGRSSGAMGRGERAGLCPKPRSAGESESEREREREREKKPGPYLLITVVIRTGSLQLQLLAKILRTFCKTGFFSGKNGTKNRCGWS